MKLLDILYEVAVQYKDTVGVGQDHNIFASKSNPDILYKVGSIDNLKHWVPIFKKHPNLFVHVYGDIKIGKFPTSSRDGMKTSVEAAYVAVEKLDANRFELMYNEISSNINLENDLDMYILQFLEENKAGYADNIEDLFPELDRNLDDNVPALYDFFYDFLELCVKINRVLRDFDFHSGQFGFDNEGRLKCLDI